MTLSTAQQTAAHTRSETNPLELVKSWINDALEGEGKTPDKIGIDVEACAKLQTVRDALTAKTDSDIPKALNKPIVEANINNVVGIIDRALASHSPAAVLDVLQRDHYITTNSLDAYLEDYPAFTAAAA